MSARAAPLPVLTTRVLERRERGYLAWVAVAGEIAELPLESAPRESCTHTLNIRVQGSDTPLVVLAEPAGSPTGSGFPLRLRPVDDAQEAALRAELFAGSNAPSPELIEAPATAPPPSPSSLTGQTLGDGRFVLEERIGGGASGEVYRAVHAVLRRPVALKVLHPSLQSSSEYCARFYGEALAASRLDHRNVLRVIDYGQEPNGMLYIVMELLQGQSLQHELDAGGRLSELRIVDLVAQACAGLAHAHDAGVVHRDIKPDNIVVVRGRDDDGRETDLVKVCDFGIAHWTQPKGQEVGAPDSSQVVGTPAYMAPEQIQNERVDARTDVYALGVILYELATGHLPFESDDPMTILRAHMVEDPPPPSVHLPSITPGLERVILKALQKEPERRQSDARALRAELRRLVEGAGSNPSGQLPKVTVTTALAAADFEKTTTDTLAKLRDADESVRAESYGALEETLRSALVEGRVKLARELALWLEQRTSESGVASSELDLARHALDVLREPEAASALAMNIFDGKVARNEDALELLRGAPIASTLIDVRRTRPPSLELRANFVAMLRALGEPALSVIVAALEPLTALATRSDEAFAEDLLRAVPDVRSDSAGDLTKRFVRLDKPPALGAAALHATTMVWGSRATPLLVGALDASHDELRSTALGELQRLDAVDDAVIERLGGILVMMDAGDQLKQSAAAAFAAATAESRPRAIAGVTAKLSPARAAREDARVLVALARSLHALDASGARAVLDRLMTARPELRASLEAIAAGR
jgi:serine/threonine protein kinase